MQKAAGITVTEDYITLENAYETFNKELFGTGLPGAFLTYQREARTFGYFSRARFVSREDGKTLDEIALNPDLFEAGRKDLEILQTLLHEMVHQWQHHHGKPSRAGYHNREFADKMWKVGLAPSSTGEPGGKETGQHMADYLVEGGLFEDVAARLLGRDRKLVRWTSPARDVAAEIHNESVELGGSDNGGEIEVPKPRTPSKLKYTCPGCGVNAWGKPWLKLMCGECCTTSRWLFLVCETD